MPQITRKEEERPEDSNVAEFAQQANSHEAGKNLVYIAGDSIIQHIQGWNLSTSDRHVKSFSGARTEDIEDYLKPLLRKEPEEIILHIGTKNIRDEFPRMVAEGIAGFHCHTIIKTIQEIDSTFKEIKEDKYSNSLAKVQFCSMFRAGDIRRNVLLKFTGLCMETPCLCHSEEHKYGGWKLTKAYVIELCYESL